MHIAGRIVLFLISLWMIFPTEKSILGDLPEGEPFVVPLAVPLLAGPSTLAMLILLVRSQPDRIFDWLIAVIGAWLVTSLIMLSSYKLYKLLGKRGLIAVERLMGMVFGGNFSSDAVGRNYHLPGHYSRILNFNV